MANLKSTNSRPAKSFFSTKVFLVLLGFSLAILSVFLWKAQESRNLSQLYVQTESKASSYSSEAEIRYNSIYNALNRLANKGIPDQVPGAGEWEKDAAFFIDSFKGIKSIAWVDKSFFIRLIAPLEENQAYLNQKANEVLLDPSDVNLWVPVYKGTQLEGFILGTINIDAFIEPVITDIKNDYMLQLANEGKIILTSENWKRPREGFVVDHTLTLQNTVVLNLSFAPTEQHLNLELANSERTLVFSLLFSFITIIAIYYAQSYNALSTLNQARYRDLLEGVELAAVILDVNGCVTFCNDYLLALTGWSRAEVLGEDWFARFVPSDWEQVKETFLAALPSGNIPANYENPILTRAGEQRWLMFNNTILRDTKGRIIGTASLGEDITERKRAQAEIIRLNADLEQRVIQRTAQLEAANKELESFSYSVSHDLRSPLRGIDGWSLALLEDYGAQLDQQAKTYLDRVRSETQRMGILIDDLLNLSRLTRTEMRKTRVDLSAIAGRIVVQLRGSAPERQVDFVTESGLSADGDAQLLDIALTNLLGNAFKFSANTAQARIEFGQIELEGRRAFFVRDNGAGFDMAFAKKLFGVFQRMHTVNEFPGTGVGLTIVQRIIHRHGGRVWAEAAVNAGAVFYFTLEENL